jgi:hypothetical protein
LIAGLGQALHQARRHRRFAAAGRPRDQSFRAICRGIRQMPSTRSRLPLSGVRL